MQLSVCQDAVRSLSQGNWSPASSRSESVTGGHNASITRCGIRPDRGEKRTRVSSALGTTRHLRRQCAGRPKLGVGSGPDFDRMSADELAQVVEASPPNDFLDRSSERGEEVGAEIAAGLDGVVCPFPNHATRQASSTAKCSSGMLGRCKRLRQSTQTG
jgi:hypothetical protein